MWEIATMAVLELRRAMIWACNGAPGGNDLYPTLKEIVEGLGVEHNLCDDLLDAASHPRAAECKVTMDLAEAIKENLEYDRDSPCIFDSANDIEKGVEGVFLRGDSMCVFFFQMKMYKEATPSLILDWLNKANSRANDLGLQDGSYVVQLFVTGAVEKKLTSRIARPNGPKTAWCLGPKH